MRQKHDQRNSAGADFEEEDGILSQRPHCVPGSRQLETRAPHLSAALSAEVKVTGQNQEQFLLLAKSAKGASLATLIHQVLEDPDVYVFGELLDMPDVRELAESDFASTFRLLTVFAYGTYADYFEARNLPPLTKAQKNKLRCLSVVTLAAKVKCIPYAVLLETLALRNVRQLEDLVMEAVYADVLRGSLDQRNQRLEVDYSIGRDIQRQDLSAIARTLQEWCVGCEVVLSGIEEQVSCANQHKEQQLGLKQQIESEVANLKKTIKVTTAAAAAAATSQDPEQHLTELREPAPGTNQRQPSKKASKGKGEKINPQSTLKPSAGK
ncbi:LOW QUALITY PROTEIN: COP9 signalosome complex subunit 7a-like [Peromyscus californicus insignis]|uniref:LOW QUALITY PROTEIN: COP9 signalosome complex subunit 7a-like n=1 Tax=Peromyscus californicus insignis TaxID=564181 RepID=UPI0022A69A80|nr:LOW QUALITY PROTEIN: COP9 signalosome complex subunit 7a-like [Peromyscus californicus insignis]